MHTRFYVLQYASKLLEADGWQGLSLYLNVDPSDPENRRAHPAYLSWLKNAFQGTPQVPEEIRRTVIRHLESHLPQGRGLALFASAKNWNEFWLPVPVGNQLHWGKPLLLPLYYLLWRYAPYLLLHVTGGRARLYQVFLAQPVEKEEERLILDTTGWRRKDLNPPTRAHVQARGGSQKDAFAKRVEHQLEMFWQQVVQDLLSLRRTLGPLPVILSGEATAIHEVLRKLRQAGLEPVETVVTGGTLADEELIRRTLEAFHHYQDRRREHEVRTLIQRTLSGEKATLGLSDTLGALREGRAKEIFAAYPLDGKIWRCSSCGAGFAENPQRCPYDGKSVEAAELAVELPLWTFRANVDLHLVDGPAKAALQQHGGIGALLHY